MAIGRKAIVCKVYRPFDLVPPIRNIPSGIPALESPSTSNEYDLEAANALLDEANWIWMGNTRVKDGIGLTQGHRILLSQDV